MTPIDPQGSGQLVTQPMNWANSCAQPVLSTVLHSQILSKSPTCSPYCSQGFSGTVEHVYDNQLPTWCAPDVIVDDLNALARDHRRLSITARDARALKRVANLIAAHDEHAEVDVAS